MRRFALLCSLLLTPACAHNTGSIHSSADYSEFKLDAKSLQLSVGDTRTQDDVPDGQYRLNLPGSFETEASSRIRGMASGQGLDLKLVVKVGRADHANIETQQGERTRVDVALNFELVGPDGTVIKHGTGGAHSEIPVEQASPEEIDKVLRETALSAFDQYWADEDVIERINGNIATYRERRGF